MTDAHDNSAIGIDPDLATEAPDEHAPDSSDGEHDTSVASPAEVDPDDGTDEDDKPVDNPAG